MALFAVVQEQRHFPSMSNDSVNAARWIINSANAGYAEPVSAKFYSWPGRADGEGDSSVEPCV
ncbi:hypothetical protein CS8_087150 [Cupriavidus sp. 8B]